MQAKLSDARAALNLPPDGSSPADLARGSSGGRAAGSAPSSPLSRKGREPAAAAAAAPMFGGGQRGGLLPRSRPLKALLVCVLALAAATLHSRGDACRGLATARGTLALANATLTNGHEVGTRGLSSTLPHPAPTLTLTLTPTPTPSPTPTLSLSLSLSLALTPTQP